MSSIDGIIRRTTLIDTSGAYQPPAIQATIQQSLGGGVYTDQQGPGLQDNILVGRLSLGIIGAMVAGAFLFYIWTHEIQGGG